MQFNEGALPATSVSTALEHWATNLALLEWLLFARRWRLFGDEKTSGNPAATGHYAVRLSSL